MKSTIETNIISLINNSNVSIFITDKNGKIIYVNKTFTKITGYSKKYALGKNPRFLCAGILPKEFYESIRKTINNGKNWEGIFINRKKDGTIYHESAIISPITNSNGEIEYFIAITNEINETEQIDGTTRYMANTIPLGLLIFNHKKKITFANKTAGTIFGIESENLINSKTDNLFSLIKEDKEVNLWKMLKNSEKPVKIEQVVLISIKEPKLVNIIATKIETKSRHFGSILLIEDITETKSKETETKRISDIKQISVFLMGFAHDFNNLLAITQMQLQNAEFYLEKDKEKVKEKLKIISEKLEEISKLTSDFFEAATSAPVYKKTNIVELINSIVSELSPLFPQTKFSLKTNKNFELTIDREKIRYTVSEIIKNAIEAQNFKGEVKIEISEALLEETLPLPLKKGQYVKISVKDRGRGIKKEFLPLLFTPYFTTKPRTNEKQTGLSLALCNFNVKKHGGYIKVKTKQGKGSEFAIYLPVADKNL